MSVYLARRQQMSAVSRGAVVLGLLGIGVARIGPAVSDVDLYPIAAGAISLAVIVLYGDFELPCVIHHAKFRCRYPR